MSTPEPDLCIVVPARNEQANLVTLVTEVRGALESEGISFTLLFVDDGSSDGTAAVIRELASTTPVVRGLILSRNFGHQAAVSIGLLHARGASVAVMDADLQDRPSDLVALYRRWQQGADVVYAVRRSRKEGWMLRTSYKIFYRVLARAANIPIAIDSGDFCVMSASFVAQLNRLPERLRYVRGLRAWLGGVQVALPVERDSRRAGKPQYDVARLFRLAIDGLVSFSDLPLRIASVGGIVVAGAAFLGAIVVLLWKVLGLLPQGAGIATIALGVFFLGGVQLLSIGILGEYLARVFAEVKGRPVAIVASVIGMDSQDHRAGAR